MRSRIRLLAALLLLALAGPHALAAEAKPYKPDPGPHKVTVQPYDWHDAKRDRDVPAKIYYPSEGQGHWPVVIVSHGLGGSRDGLVYLGRHWASHGYVSVHIQHLGSDTAVWKGKKDWLAAMRGAVADVRNAIVRPGDVRFAIDEVTRMHEGDGPLAGRLDLERVGMAGHSFGAWTTLAVAGQLAAGRRPLFRDGRVKAAIPLSPSPAPPHQRHKAYGQIRIPLLHMTGTLDTSPVRDTKAIERRIPFDRIMLAEQYLITFKGGDHMVFSGTRWQPAPNDKDPVFHSLILQSTTAFLDAYLRGDEAARRWLAEGGFEAVLGEDGVFEQKHPKTAPTPPPAERVQPGRSLSE